MEDVKLSMDESKPDYLAEFASRSDRQDPPAFVGRRDILQQIADDLQNRLSSWRRGADDAWRGGTWLVQGAPGAGKTALLAELRKNVVLSTVPVAPDTPSEDDAGADFVVVSRRKLKAWASPPLPAVSPVAPESHSPVRTCELHVRDLHDPSWCHQVLAEVLWPGTGKALGARITSTGEAALQVPGLRAGRSVATDSPGMTWRGVLLAARAQPERLHPVVLLIDEVQNVSGGREGPAAGVLQWLHEATDNLPVLPVYGGLAWSEEHLDGLGVSRLSNNGRVDTLGSLTVEERAEAVQRFVLSPKYRIRTAGMEDPLIAQWAAAIAEECSGWPQHLHVSLWALARELLREDVGRELARAQPERAAADAEKAREDYYNKRLGNSRLDGRSQLAGLGVLAVQAGGAAGVPLDIMTLGDALERFAACAGPFRPTLRLPPPVPDQYGTPLPLGESMVVRMIQAGMLHFADDELSVPIPSLVRYVQQRYRQPLREPLQRFLAEDSPVPGWTPEALLGVLPQYANCDRP